MKKLYKIFAMLLLIGVTGLYTHGQNSVVFLAGSTSNTSDIFKSEPTGIIMSINPGSWNFGTITANTNSTHTFTISNSSSSTGILTINWALSAPYFVTPMGTVHIQIGQSRTFTIKFKPCVGPFNYTSNIINNSTNLPSSVPITLSGTGICSGIQMSIGNGTSTSFGNIAVGQTGTRNIILCNSCSSCGNLNINFNNLTLPFTIVSPIAVSIPPGQCHTFIINCTPTITGPLFQILHGTNNSTNYGSFLLHLTGTGT